MRIDPKENRFRRYRYSGMTRYDKRRQWARRLSLLETIKAKSQASGVQSFSETVSTAGTLQA